MATSSPDRARLHSRTIWAALVIVAGTLLAYHNTFGVPYLFDDNSSIKDNPTIRSLWQAWWPPPQSGLTVSGRPLLNLSLALNYAVSGLDVWSYHALNLLIHAVAGCLLFGVVRRTLLRPGLAGKFGHDSFMLALLVALIWTLHPLQTESVTYIVQRAESLVGLCYLLTLWCFIRSIEPGASSRWSWFTFAACLLGMTAKEVMVTAPVLVALYDRVFVAGSWREVWEKRGRRHLALVGTWLLLAGLVLATGNRGGTAGFGTSVSSYAYALTQVDAVVKYLRLAVWPYPLVFDYGQWLAGGWREVWWQALVLVPLVAISVVALLRGRAAGYCGVFFFTVLAPSSSFVPVATQTMAEHRMYLPLAAVVVLVVLGIYARLGRGSLLVFSAVALVLGATTVRRNHDYRTELAIWEDAVAKRPFNVRALAAVGAIHQAAGRSEEARVILQEAVRVAPRSVEAHNNLGNAWMKSGRWLDAISCFEAALTLKPAEPYALNNLGNALLQTGRVPEAIVRFEAALRVKPDFAEPRYNLANTLAQAGRLAEAAPHYAALLVVQPDDAEAHSNYGDVLMELGRGAEAIAQFETAVRLKPDNAELHNNFGVALARSGRPAEALVHFQAALRLQPDFAGAKENAERAARAVRGG